MDRCVIRLTMIRFSRHDFLQWKSDNNQREIKVMRRYHIQNRDDYHK